MEHILRQLDRSWEAYGRIEQSTTDSEPDPRIYGQGKAKAQADVEQSGGLAALVELRRNSVGDLCAREGKEEKEEGADEFSTTGYEVIARGVVESVCKWETGRLVVAVALLDKGETQGWRRGGFSGVHLVGRGRRRSCDYASADLRL